LALYAGQDDVRTVSSSEREHELRKRRRGDPVDHAVKPGGNGAAK
jgi:hypothetical protein